MAPPYFTKLTPPQEKKEKKTHPLNPQTPQLRKLHTSQLGSGKSATGKVSKGAHKACIQTGPENCQISRREGCMFYIIE